MSVHDQNPLVRQSVDLNEISQVTKASIKRNRMYRMNQLSEGQLQQHVTVLGWLHIVGNGIMLLLGCFVFALLLGIPGIVAGYGLLRRRAWGRILAMVVGFLGLVNFPLGTAIGIYTFWVLLQNAAADYFSS